MGWLSVPSSCAASVGYFCWDILLISSDFAGHVTLGATACTYRTLTQSDHGGLEHLESGWSNGLIATKFRKDLMERW